MVWCWSVLCCIVLYCIAFYCIVWRCFVSHSSEPRCGHIGRSRIGRRDIADVMCRQRVRSPYSLRNQETSIARTRKRSTAKDNPPWYVADHPGSPPSWLREENGATLTTIPPIGTIPQERVIESTPRAIPKAAGVRPHSSSLGTRRSVSPGSASTLRRVRWSVCADPGYRSPGPVHGNHTSPLSP